MAREFTKLGYYIALGGALTFKNARHSVEVCESIDEKYLLSETDCPYMAPVPYRGKRNEPSYIPLIVKKMAEVRGESEEHMASVILANWERFLRSCEE
jgi:TatD DNase family protein